MVHVRACFYMSIDIFVHHHFDQECLSKHKQIRIKVTYNNGKKYFAVKHVEFSAF